MPETSAEYHILCHSCATAKLSIEDLPETDIRGDLDQMRLKSYIFLSHAAFEEYLESVTISALRRARRLMLADGRASKLIVSAVSHYRINTKGIWPLVAAKPSVIDALDKLAEQAINEHIAAVYENHGIKTKDQNNLCLPLGISVHAFDHVLSQNLNSFGEKRGKIAHGFRMSQIVPKAGCLQSVQSLTGLLLPLDQEIVRLTEEVW